MITVGLIARVLASDIAQIGRIIIGDKITFRLRSLISPHASLRTFGKGKILYGNKTEVRPNSEITARDGLVKIGKNCFINRNCMIVAHEAIEIGDNVTIGPGTVIYDHDHDGDGSYVTKPVKIGNGTWLGANVTILKGVRVGEKSVIAAGTIVTKDIPSNVIVYQKRDLTIIKRNVDKEHDK